MRIPKFGDMVFEKEEHTHKNYRNFFAGKERLETPFLLHPDGDDVYDYVKSKVERNFWMSDPDKLRKAHIKNNKKF